MGRGNGGYTEVSSTHSYKDSGGHKVTDQGAIWIGERYIEAGYETVFRQQHPQRGTQYDLTIKTSDDTEYVKNIEVKQLTTRNPSNIAKNIHDAGKQIGDGDTVALYFPTRKSTPENLDFVNRGIAEAGRKGYVKGPIEVWFSDKTKHEYGGT